jgi:hypothetical protein
LEELEESQENNNQALLKLVTHDTLDSQIKLLNDSLNAFAHTESAIAARPHGDTVISLAPTMLEYFYPLKIKDEKGQSVQFVMDKKWEELYDEILNDEQCLTYDSEGIQNREKEIVAKMKRLIFRYLYFHLQRTELVHPEMAEEWRATKDNSGEGIGLRKVVKYSEKEIKEAEDAKRKDVKSD